MLMSLLLLSWLWDRVVTNCKGGPETIHHYYLQATVRRNFLGMCPTEVPNQYSPCNHVVPSPPVRFGPDIGDPGTGTTVITYVDAVSDPDLLPNPPVGSLMAWPWRTADNPAPVVSVDMAGLSCTETCQ